MNTPETVPEPPEYIGLPKTAIQRSTSDCWQALIQLPSLDWCVGRPITLLLFQSCLRGVGLVVNLRKNLYLLGLPDQLLQKLVLKAPKHQR